MNALMFDYSLETEFRCNIFSTEECVHPGLCRVKSVEGRISVDDDYILQQQGAERLQMDLFETDVSVKLVFDSFYRLAGNESLDLRHL